MSQFQEGKYEANESIFIESYRAGFQQLADGLLSVQQEVIEKFKKRADILPAKFRNNNFLGGEIRNDIRFLNDSFGDMGNFQIFSLNQKFDEEIREKALQKALPAPETYSEDSLCAKLPSLEKEQIKNLDKIRDAISQIEELFSNRLREKLKPFYSRSHRLQDNSSAQRILSEEFAILKQGLNQLNLTKILEVDSRTGGSILEHFDDLFYYDQ